MNKYIVPWRNVRIPHLDIIPSLIAAISSYICIFPLILIDVFMWQFQHIYFRIFEIPFVERKKYVILDRYKLGKLTFSQKVNCLYCEYANGIVAFLKAIVNQMELYSCAIKHEHHPLGQNHQNDFFEREKFE